MEINEASMNEFGKLLIEMGGLYEVREDSSIYTKAGRPVQITIGKEKKDLFLFRDGMPNGDYIALNIFKDDLGVNRERQWFFETRNVILGTIMQELMKYVIKVAVNKDDENIESYSIVNKISNLGKGKTPDEKMIGEITDINYLDILNIFYNKKQKTAQIQSNMLSNASYAEDHNIRDKTMTIIRILMKELTGTDDIEGSFVYTSKSLEVAELDAKLTVMISFIEAINSYSKDFLNIDLCPEQLKEHMKHLEGYTKIRSWFSSSVPVSKEKAQLNDIPPWERNNTNPFLQVQQNPYQPVQMQQQPVYQQVPVPQYQQVPMMQQQYQQQPMMQQMPYPQQMMAPMPVADPLAFHKLAAMTSQSAVNPFRVM